MPEAEDVITDAARHATVFVRDLWRRHHPEKGVTVDVPALLHRLDLLITGAFGASFRLRVSQPPAPVPLVRKMFLRDEQPRTLEPIPATDGESIWLPMGPPHHSIEQLRVLALQQAARAQRCAPSHLTALQEPLARTVFEVLEAHAADGEIVRLFPGMANRIDHLRRDCLQARPPVQSFPLVRRPLEAWVRTTIGSSPAAASSRSASESLERAQHLAQGLMRDHPSFNRARMALLFRDDWTGALQMPGARPDRARAPSESSDNSSSTSRSARMARRPNVRPPDERDEQQSQGAWMVQTAQPHEHAEDPLGAQRPTDRDEHQAAEEFADSVSELTEARLVSTPGAPKEVLLSDDPPPTSGISQTSARDTAVQEVLRYPEWDWRIRAYRDPGVAIRVLAARHGSHEWIERTLEQHRSLLQSIRQQFEPLRAQRLRLRQQSDGDDLDLSACVDALADLRAGAGIERGLYQCTRNSRRELAVQLLIDVSGSTDGWVSQHRRVIDVEREALLLVCLALEGLGEPYGVLAFSGEGAQGVTVRSVKAFDEVYSAEIGLRIAGLEPERYTRAGAAIRHASTLLMREPARHRLLLLLSDGKPNDADEYDGRYGVEDMRQAIIEARLQGIFPFCLTIDRHTANYLPSVFGEHQYAVLHRPERLPVALLGWLRRLVQG
jgi:nitric oxide reductase NorD protein